MMRVSFKRIACLGLLILAACAAQAERPEYDLEVVAHQIPAALKPMQTVDVPLRLRNRGSVTWDPERSFNVAYHWRAADGKVTVWDGQRTPLPRRVGPGEEIALKVRVTTPHIAEPSLLQWDVVQESVTWISEKDPTPDAPIRVSIVTDYAFALFGQHVPRMMWTEQVRRIPLVVRNDGTESWSPARRTHFSYHWLHETKDKADFDGVRTSLPHRVDRNGSVALRVELHAPPKPGLYRLQWDMVEEQVLWFSQRDPTPESAIRVIVLPMQVRGPAAASILAVFCLALILLAFYRQSTPPWVIAAASATDVIWLGAALLFKQMAVSDEIQDVAATAPPWVAIGTVALMAILVALLPGRIRPWMAVVANAIVSALILIDVLHLRFFGDVTSLATLRSAGQIGSVMRSAIALLEPRDLWLVLDFAAGLPLVFFVLRLLPRVGARPARRLALLLVPLLFPAMVVTWRISTATAGTFVQVFRTAFLVEEIGILNTHVRDVWIAARTRLMRRELAEARKAAILQWFHAHAPERAVGPSFGVARGKNLIMLQVESMQAFVVGMRINGQEVTPNLDRWRSSGALWFPGCADQTAQGRTSDGEFVTQTSLLPLAQGAVAFRFGSNHYDAIAAILGTHGYTTLSAVPFPGAFWNRRITHRQYGFQSSLYDGAFKPGVNVGWGLNDRDFLLQMIPRLDSSKTPFAAYLITLSNHYPYDSFPEQLKELSLGRWEGTPLGNYVHTMHHFDRAFGEFLEALAGRGLLEQTVIVLWGDHAAGLPWDRETAEVMGHRPTEPEYYVVNKVPVMIGVPGAGPELRGMRDVPCGQTDLAPTLLSLLGIDGAAHPFLGRNLLGQPGNGPVVQRYGVWNTRELLYLPKGPTLEDGLCYALPSLARVPVARCGTMNREAQALIAISRDIVEHDLQIPLTRSALDRR